MLTLGLSFAMFYHFGLDLPPGGCLKEIFNIVEIFMKSTQHTAKRNIELNFFKLNLKLSFYLFKKWSNNPPFDFYQNKHIGNLTNPLIVVYIIVRYGESIL